MAGLGKALKSRFPVVEKIVGEEFFAAMTRVFVKAQPPRSPLLATYGDDFPDFIATFEPARGLPYLADVARLEATRTRSYHAATSRPSARSTLRRSMPHCRGYPGRYASLDRDCSLGISHRHDLGDEQRRRGACAD